MHKAVFLDRDGVINDNEMQHVNKPEDLLIYPGVCEAIRKLNDAGFMVFVVTNQGGVGLGYMTAETLGAVHTKMEAELLSCGARIDEVSACIHAPKAGCECRKPRPGMITTLAAKHHIDIGASWMVGDRDTDCQAGKAAGIRKNIQLGGESEWSDYTATNLVEAVEIILSGE